MGLNWNCTRDEGHGGKALGAALAANGALTSLNLHGDKIGGAGGIALIAEGLKVNGPLTSNTGAPDGWHVRDCF